MSSKNPARLLGAGNLDKTRGSGHSGGFRVRGQDEATDGHPVPVSSAVISAQNVTRVFGHGPTAVAALRGVSLTIPQGQFAAIVGPSGSGKSTLMHILAGLDRPTEGRVEVAGRDITRLDETGLTRLRREKIGFVFQFFNLLPMLTAEQNVTLPLELARVAPDRAWVQEIMNQVGLLGRRAHRPAELSGGEQQRVAVARALVSKPAVLFADEPTGNLDSATADEILQLLRHFNQQYGQTILMVTHDPRAAAAADRNLLLADGRLVQDVLAAGAPAGVSIP